MLGLIILSAVLVIANGLYVAAEFAIVTCSKIELQKRADQGSMAARKILDVRRDPRNMNRYIATAQVGITLASLALGMVAEPAIAGGLAQLLGLEDSHSPWLVLAAILVMTYPHVVVGEMIPKALALHRPTEGVLLLRPFMNLSRWVFSLLVISMDALGNKILGWMGMPLPDEARRLFSREELEMVVHHSRTQGVVGRSEELMVENIFDLGERTAGDIMTPRVNMDALPSDVPLEEIYGFFDEHQHSRVPIYTDTPDQIVGLLYCKDLARYWAQDDESAFDLLEHLRPPRFVPRSTAVDELLRLFQRERLQMVIVLDEHGGTAGLVTFEDVIEEVVGEIRDEFDEEEEPLTELEPGILHVQGDLLLDELAQYLRIELEHPSVRTVAGLLQEELRNLPKVGQGVEWHGLNFHVLGMTGRQVTRVEVRVPQPSDEKLEASE